MPIKWLDLSNSIEIDSIEKAWTILDFLTNQEKIVLMQALSWDAKVSFMNKNMWQRYSMIEFKRTYHASMKKAGYNFEENDCEDFLWSVLPFINSCEETDEYIKIGRIKIYKRQLSIDDVQPRSEKHPTDVFSYQMKHYSWYPITCVGMTENVLNNKDHHMHGLIKDALKKEKKDWRRRMTKADIDYIFSQLPWIDESQKIWALQLATWWVGPLVLADVISDRDSSKKKDWLGRPSRERWLVRRYFIELWATGRFGRINNVLCLNRVVDPDYGNIALVEDSE